MNTEPVELTVFAHKPVEFRLYYDDKGNVTHYTCEKLEGNYIVIDVETYAAARPDLRVINGKISSVAANARASILKPGLSGIRCAKDDISVVVDDKYAGSTLRWKVENYEL